MTDLANRNSQNGNSNGHNHYSGSHQQLQEGKITISQGLLMDTNINRSPHAYLLNPAEERSQYEHNVDKTMTVLGFKNIEGDDMGLVSWYIL